MPNPGERAIVIVGVVSFAEDVVVGTFAGEDAITPKSLNRSVLV